MATIAHFDIPVDNVERAKRFYESLFDWTIEKTPGEMPYWFIGTTDLNGQKSVGGGMAKREKAGQQITNFIGVRSIAECLERVKDLGGDVLQPKTPIPGWGHLAVCLDTEGNTFGLWEEDQKTKA